LFIPIINPDSVKDRIYSYIIFDNNTIIFKHIDHYYLPYDILILLTTFFNIFLCWKFLHAFPLFDLAFQIGQIYINKGDSVLSYLINKMENEKPLIALAVIMLLVLILDLNTSTDSKTNTQIKDITRSPRNSGGSNNPSKRRKAPMF